MTKKEETQVIELKPLSIKQARITIAGDGDLVLNKMIVAPGSLLTRERTRLRTQQLQMYGKK